MKRKNKIVLFVIIVVAAIVTVIAAMIIKNKMDYNMSGTVIVTDIEGKKTYYLVENDKDKGLIILCPIDNNTLFEDLHSGDSIKIRTRGNGWSLDPAPIYVYNYRIVERGSLDEVKKSNIWEFLEKYGICENIVER